MIGDRKRVFTDSGGLGMKIELDPAQISSMRGDILYRFGESTIEVDFAQVYEVPKDHPFARIADPTDI